MYCSSKTFLVIELKKCLFSSELNPLEAPVWKLKVKFEKTPTLLNEYLQRFLQLSQFHVESTAQIIRSLSHDDTHDADLGKIGNIKYLSVKFVVVSS